MADRPRRFLIRTNQPRPLATALAGLDAVRSLEIVGNDLTIATMNAGEFALALPQAAVEHGCVLTEVRPLDESLESLFRELSR